MFILVTHYGCKFYRTKLDSIHLIRTTISVNNTYLYGNKQVHLSIFSLRIIILINLSIR